MGHEDGHRRARGVGFGGEGFGEGQVRGEGQEAGEPRRVSQALVEGDGAALGEAGQHHVVLAHPSLLLARDEGAHLGRRRADARASWGMLRSRARMSYQARMAMAAVDGDGPDVGMGEHEANPQGLGEAQLGHERLEVVAVGPQAVEPDHAGLGLRPGLDFHRFEQGGHAAGL